MRSENLVIAFTYFMTCPLCGSSLALTMNGGSSIRLQHMPHTGVLIARQSGGQTLFCKQFCTYNI
jgi:C4-type Zn-finger protein